MTIVILIAALLAGSLQEAPGTAERLERRQVRELVRLFGRQLQYVSPLAPAALFEEQLREHYGPYVADALLAEWLAEPGLAPGRHTSSPWPQRVEVLAVHRVEEGGFQVNGEIVYVTSVELAESRGAAAAIVPVRLRVERTGGRWQVTGFVISDAGETASRRPSLPPSEPRNGADDRAEPLVIGDVALPPDPPPGFALADEAAALPGSVVPPCPHGFTICYFYAGVEFEGTNLVSAGLAARTLALPRSACESATGNYPVVREIGRVKVGGLEFLVFETDEAGMSKVARDVVYRRWGGGTCIEFTSRIATANPGVYETGAVEPLGPAELNALRQRLRAPLEAVRLLPQGNSER